MAGQRLALVGIALIATLSVDASAELVRGGAVKVTAPAPPPSVTSPSGPPPPAPYEVNPDDVRYTGAAYMGSNLFGSGYKGITTLGFDLGVLQSGDVDRWDFMSSEGRFAAQSKLLHRMARRLIPLDESYELHRASLEVLATLAGYYVAIAADCNLPTAPIEAALDKILRDGSVAPSEAERHKLTMIRLRGAFAGAGTVLGCVEAKRQVDIALQVKAH
jgi:hypothetical protein